MRTAANVGKVLLCLLAVLFVFAVPLAAADVVEYRLKQIEETSAEQKKQLDRLEHRTANIEEDTTLLSGFSNQVSKFGLPKWAGQFVGLLLTTLLLVFGYLKDAKRRIDKIKKEAKEEKDEVSRKFNDFQKTHQALERTYQKITNNNERLSVLLEQDNIESNNRRLAALLTNIDDGNPLLQQVSEVQKVVDVLKTAQPITLEDALAMKIEDLRNVAGIYLFPCHARLAMEEGNWEEACFFWQKYLAVAPDNAVSLYYLGWCLLQQGKSTKDILPADQYRLFIEACYYFEHVLAMPDLQGHKHFQWPLSEARFRASFCCADPQKAKRLRRKAMESLADIATRENAHFPEMAAIVFWFNLEFQLGYRQRRFVARLALLTCRAVKDKYNTESSFFDTYGNVLTFYARCSSSHAERKKILLLALENFECNIQYSEGDSFSGLINSGYCLTELAQIEPDDVKAGPSLQRALDYYTQAIALNPTASNVWSSAGFSLIEIARRQESTAAKRKSLYDARKKCETAVELDPKNSVAWSNTGLVLRALALLENDTALQFKLLNDALEKSMYAAELDPTTITAYANAGYCLQQLAFYEKSDSEKCKRLYEALKNFSNASIEPQLVDTTIWISLAETLMFLSDIEHELASKHELLCKAVKNIKRAVKNDKECSSAWSTWGVTLIGLSKLEPDNAAKEKLLRDALEKCEQAKSIDPAEPAAWSNVGATLVELSRMTPDVETKRELLQSAVEKYERVVQLDSTRSHSFSLLGSALKDLAGLTTDGVAKGGLLRDALKKFARAVELDPTDDWARERVENLQSELAKMA